MKEKNTENERFLKFLYHTAPGRLLLKPLSSRALSVLCGRFLDSGLSRPLIAPFVRRHGIDLSEYQGGGDGDGDGGTGGFHSFNEFFTRKIREGKRPFDPAPEALIAPCDGFLSAYEILPGGTVIPVKYSRYTVASLLNGDPVAEELPGGLCLVFRLCTYHYHRYCYFDGGEKERSAAIRGRLHTVRPVALADVPVFTENCREYTVLRTEHFGRAVQMEVGAMLVGKIRNRDGGAAVRRGEEKGMFLYGGSTVIVLLRAGTASLRDDLLPALQRGEEVPVKMGERIGCGTAPEGSYAEGSDTA